MSINPDLPPVENQAAKGITRRLRLPAPIRRVGPAIWRRIRRAREADGTATTGMHRLFDVHAASVAGDAMVAVALAQTVFFSVPLGEARTKVALYLVITMLPFALLAPLIGPVLDRFRHGRRYALAITMLARAFLCWALADQWHTWVLYPAALGILVMSRAYGVARSAAVPRLLPEKLTLVEANARGSLAGIIAGALAGGAAVGISQLGAGWTLRAAALVFVVGMILAIRLPPRTDSQEPETVPRIFPLPGRKTQPHMFDAYVWIGLTATGGMRMLYGFATLFFAFRTRVDNFYDLAPTLVLGIVAASLGAGSFVSTIVGTRLKLRHPLRLHAGAVVVTAACCVAAALEYQLPTVIALGFVIALCSGLCKLGVDALIQQRVTENYRSSAFAHSETGLQLAWVFGGIIGLLPVNGPWGLTIAAVVLGAALVRVAQLLLSIRRGKRPTKALR